MNEPLMVIQPTLLFESNYNFRVKYVLTTFFYIVLFTLFESNLIFICVHFLTVNKRYFGYCHIKNIPLCSFLEFRNHLRENSEDRFKILFTNVQRF